MSKRKRDRRKVRSHNAGLWIITDDGNWNEVKKSKISSDKIVDDPPIRYGLPGKDKIELVERATFPVFREDVVELVIEEFEKLNFTAEKLFPDDDMAHVKLNNFITAATQVSQNIPLAKYQRGFVNKDLEPVEDPVRYQVVEVTEEGEEVLDKFPYLEMTHQMHERDPETGKLNVLPREYWDLWLPETQYEVIPYDDPARFQLHEFAKKLDNYPFPNPETEEITYQEAMLYHEGYVLKSGSTKAYYAFMRPVWITGDDGEEKFLFELKFSRTITKYQKAVEVPQAGELPQFVATPQKTLKMKSVADMLAQVVA